MNGRNSKLKYVYCLIFQYPAENGFLHHMQNVWANQAQLTMSNSHASVQQLSMRLLCCWNYKNYLLQKNDPLGSYYS